MVMVLGLEEGLECGVYVDGIRLEFASERNERGEYLVRKVGWCPIIGEEVLWRPKKVRAS